MSMRLIAGEPAPTVLQNTGSNQLILQYLQYTVVANSYSGVFMTGKPSLVKGTRFMGFHVSTIQPEEPINL